MGLAIGAGTDVAIESADIVLMKSDLLDAVTAVELSRATIRNVKENLFWAFLYNTIGIPLAAGVFFPVLGWQLNPMFAAAAMSLSSVSVVSNALRLKLFQPRHKAAASPKTQSKTEKEVYVMERTLTIEGMMCQHCAAHVTKALNALPGVTATVDLHCHWQRRRRSPEKGRGGRGLSGDYHLLIPERAGGKASGASFLPPDML